MESKKSLSFLVSSSIALTSEAKEYEKMSVFSSG